MRDGKEQFKHGPQHGYGKASRCGSGLTSPKVSEVILSYRQLNTDEARAAFADRWLTLLAERFEATWPILYELLAIVRDKELYKFPQMMVETQQTFDTFEQYFEHMLGQPFSVWGELESTYHFVATCKPDLLRAGYQQARTAREMAGDPEVKALADGAGAPEGSRNNPSGLPKGGEPNVDDINISPPSRPSGTSVSYLVRRLKRDAPEIAEALARGDYPSARAAAKAAGIIKTPTPLQALQRAWAKASDNDRIALLTDLDPAEKLALVAGFDDAQLADLGLTRVRRNTG